jgi:signal transduction histidine kinase
VLWRGRAKVSDLQELVGRFLGPTKAELAFAGYARRHGVGEGNALEADARLVQFAESLLAGAIGSASARVMVASVAKEEPLSIDEVMHILDEASQLRTYSRELERKSRELTAATLELQEANERLQELDRVKDDIMSSVTHELRTPLTSIRAFSELLRDDPKMHLADRERFLGLIVSEAERLTRLINQTLDLAKIESGRADWNACELDLKEVIEQSVAATSQLFREKGAHVELDLPDNLPLILADRDRLIQVMLNLLSNAVKFLTPGSGRVTVDVAHAGRRTGSQCGRQRAGNSSGRSTTDFREVPPGGRHDDRQAVRYRARAADQPAHCRALRGAAVGGKRAGRGGDLPLYPAFRSRSGAGACAGCSSIVDCGY